MSHYHETAITEDQNGLIWQPDGVLADVYRKALNIANSREERLMAMLGETNELIVVGRNYRMLYHAINNKCDSLLK